MSTSGKILYDVIQFDQWRGRYSLHTPSSRWTLPTSQFSKFLSILLYSLMVPIILLFTLPKQLFTRSKLRPVPTRPPLSLSASSCHKHLAVLTPSSLIVLVRNSKLTPANSSLFSRQSGYVYSLSDDVTLRRHSPLQVAWSPDSRYLVVLIAASSSHHVMVFDTKANKIGELDLSARGITDPSQVLLAGYGPHQLIHRCVVLCRTGCLGWFEIRSSGETGRGSERTDLRGSHPGGASCMCYHPETELLFVGGSAVPGPERGHTDPLRRAISVWRVVEQDCGFVQVHHSLGARSASPSRRGDDVTNISLSSSSPRMLLTSHQNGTLAVWSVPSLTAHRRIPRDTSTFLSDTLVSCCWWSDGHVAASYSSGRLAILDVESERNIAREESGVGGPLVMSTLYGNKSALAVCYNEAPGVNNNNTMTVKERACQLVFALTRVSSLQQFEVSDFACEYRLLLLKQASPIDLYKHKISQQLYSDALLLATEFALDLNLLYQSQWESSSGSLGAVSLFLSRITDTAYVLGQVLLARGPDAESAARSIELGLSRIQDSTSSQESSQLSTLPPNQYEPQQKLLVRMNQMLDCYSGILSNSASKFDSVTFRQMCFTPLLQLMSLLAVDRNYTAIQLLYEKFYHQLCAHFLSILIFIPEIELPSNYQSLIPTNIVDSVPTSCSQNIHDDLGEIEFYETHSGLIRFRNTLPTSVESLTEWFVFRARQIDNISGQYNNAAILIAYGISNGVPELLQTQHDLWFLAVLVEHIGGNNSGMIGLCEVEKLSSLERIRVILETVVVANFFDRFKEYIEPILDFNETCFEGNKLQLMREFMLEIAKENLPLCQVLFKKCFVDKHCILSPFAMICLAMECIYACLTPAQLPNAFSIFECIPRSEAAALSEELSGQLTQLESVLKSASIFQSYSIFLCPHELLRHQKGEEQDVRLLILRQASKLANQRLFPPRRRWEQLLVDILSLKETVFPQLTRNTCYSLFSQALMSSRCQEGVRLAASLLRVDPSGLNRLSKESYSSETWICCLSFEESVDVVMQASQQYFNASSHFMDQHMQLARTCLQLIQPPTEAIQEELNLIGILSLLDDLKFDILPAYLRDCDDRASLLKNAIDAKPENYRRKQKIEKLLTLLKISTTPEDDGTIVSSEISISLAERAFFYEDWRTCEDYCYVLMRSRYSNAWDVCHRLGAVEGFSNLSSRKNLLGFAIENCPVNRMESVLYSSTLLTNQLLETATSQSAGTQVMNKMSFIMGKALKTTGLNRFSYFTSFAQNTIENNTEVIPNNPKQLSINKHSFYNSNTKFSLFSHLIASQTELFRNYSLIQGMNTAQDFFKDPNYLHILNSYLIACLSAVIHSDSTLAIGYMMAMYNHELASNAIKELPQQHLILEFYIYCIALQICFRGIKHNEVSSMLLMSPIDFVIDFESSYLLFKQNLRSNSGLMLEFENATRQLHLLWEADILQEMKVDFDVDFYLADINYQNVIIRKVAQNSNTFDFALSIGEHHGISREVLFIEFLNYLLIQSSLGLHELNLLFVKKGIFDCLTRNPHAFAESLHTNIYPQILGTDYERLLACVELLGRCESVIGEPIHFIPNCTNTCVELTSLIAELSQTVPLMDFKAYSRHSDSIAILKEHLTIENIPKLSKVALISDAIAESHLYFALCSQLIDSYNPSLNEISVDNLSLISAMDYLSVDLIVKLFKECIFSTKALSLNPTQLQFKFQFICTAINQISSNTIKKELHIKISLFSKHMHVCLSHPISSFPLLELKDEFFLSRSEPELVADILSRYLKSGTPVNFIIQVLAAASSVTPQYFNLASTFHDTAISLSYELQENYSLHPQISITSLSAYNIINKIFKSLSNHEMCSHSITPELLSQLLHDIINSPDFSTEVKGFLSQLFQSSPLVDINGIDWYILKLKIKSQIDLCWDYDVMDVELELELNRIKLVTDLSQLSTTEDHYSTLCIILEFLPNSKHTLNDAWFSILLAWSKSVIDFNRFFCRRAILEFNESQDDIIFKVLTSTDKIKSLLYLLVTRDKQLILAEMDSLIPLLSEPSYYSMKNEMFELIIINDLTPVIMQSKLWGEFLTHFQQVSSFPLTELCCLVNRHSQLIPDNQNVLDIISSQLYQAGFKLEAAAIKVNSAIPSRFLSFNSIVKWISQHDKL